MRHPARKLNARRAIALLVALVVPIATVPRATACDCAAKVAQGESECACCQPIAVPVSCCAEGNPPSTCCSKESGGDCDCPKCQGEHLLKLDLFAKSDRFASEGHSPFTLFVAIVETPVDIWLAGRISERPPPEVYLARHGPQLERLCRWLI